MKDKAWTRRERKLLRERGGRAPAEVIARSLGRGTGEVRRALGEMGLAPRAGKAARERRPAESALFAILIALCVSVPLVWSPAAKDNFLLPQALLMGVLAASAVCAWLAGLALSGEARVRRSPAPWIAAVLALSLAPSCLVSANPRLSLDALAWYAACAAVLLLAASFSPTPRRLRAFSGALIAVASAEALYGSCQFFGWDPLFRAPDIARLKVFGTLGNPNFLSGFLSAVLPLALAAALDRYRSAARRACAAGSSVVVASGVLLTGTKGSLLAAAASSALVLSYVLARRRLFGVRAAGPLALAAVLAAAAAGVTAVSRAGAGAFDLPATVVRSLDARGLSVGKRLLYAKTSVEMIRARPLAGWGPGTYRLHYLDRQADVLARPENASFIPLAGNPVHAHNDYLELWAESGPLALAAFLALLAAVAARGLRAASRPPDAVLFLGFLGGFASLCITALVCFPLHRASTAVLFWAFAGMLSAGPEEPGGWIVVRAPRAFSAALLAASCALLVFACSYSVARLRAEERFARGYAASRGGEWRDAASHYRNGLALYPRDGEARINLGLALYRLGEWDKSIAEIERGFREIRDFGGQLTLADACDEKGETARALEEYREAIRLNPRDGSALNNMGVCLARQGRSEEAEAAWGRAGSLPTPHADSLANLAANCLARGKREEAKKWAARALSSGASGDSQRKARLVLERASRP